MIVLLAILVIAFVIFKAFGWVLGLAALIVLLAACGSRR